jgi:hypothetical protein
MFYVLIKLQFKFSGHIRKVLFQLSFELLIEADATKQKKIKAILIFTKTVVFTQILYRLSPEIHLTFYYRHTYFEVYLTGFSSLE